MVTHWLSHSTEIKWTLLFDREVDYFKEFDVERVIIKPRVSHTPSIAFWNEIPLTRWLNKTRPDIYISPDGFIPLRSRVKCVPVVHDLAALVYPQYMRWRDYIYYRVFQTRIIRKAWKVLTVSEFSKYEIVKYTSKNIGDIYVGYNGLGRRFRAGVDTTLDSLRFDISKPYFIYIGSIHPRKNVFGLLKSFELYRASGGTASLVIAGRKAWKSTRFEKEMVESSVAENIVWLPYMQIDELRSVFQQALCLVYISHYEGFGLPVLEAMALGVPVITSCDSAMSEIGGDAVLCHDPLDHSCIAKSMLQVEVDAQLRKNLSEQGKIQSRKFTYKASAQNILKYLKSNSYGN